MTSPALAVVCVRDAALPAGAVETAAEVADGGGRVLLVGQSCADAADALHGVVANVEVVEAGGFAPASWAQMLEPLVDDAAFVLMPSSPDGRDLATQLAARLGWPLLAGALSVDASEVVVARQGGLVQHRGAPHGPFVATLQPGVRGVSIDAAITTQVVELMPRPELDPASPPARDAGSLGLLPLDATTIDLADAPRLVGGGAGLMRTDDVARRFEQLAAVGEAIGASMGATRVVTDAGWVGHDRQIGTTGVMVDPRLYLAFGISGAVQHTAGLGHPDHIVSVNVDPYCPMMAMADLAVTGDANEILDELAARLGVGS